MELAPVFEFMYIQVFEGELGVLFNVIILFEFRPLISTDITLFTAFSLSPLPFRQGVFLYMRANETTKKFGYIWL